MITKIKFLTLFLLTSFSLIGQGKIHGLIVDVHTGESLPFVSVFVPKLGTGTTTDIDGNYELALDTGTYTIEFSYIGYTTQIVEEVAVKDNETVDLPINLTTASQMIDEIVVTSRQLRNTENAVLAIQRMSTNLLDGISSQAFRKIGDSDAASAIKRVTGVSVENGKYVYVRGLGDRYTKSILNGMSVPGLDPDRNTLQMDIFPVNIIDNITVTKNFTPDLSGDFTGGIVNIQTKDFPESKTIQISAGVGYNPNMHFTDRYLSYEGSSTDFLGYDNGKRTLPINKRTIVPSIVSNSTYLTQLTQRFDNQWAAQRKTNAMDYNFGLYAGNQIDFHKAILGFNAALNYRKNTTYYDQVLFNTYIKANDISEMKLVKDRTQEGELGTSNVLLSGLLGGSIKVGANQVSLSLLHIQNGESKAGIFDQNSYVRNSNTLIKDNLEYSQRSISNVTLLGKHEMKEAGFMIDWKLSPTFSSIRDKDIRIAPFRLDDGEFSIEPSEGAEPRRLWRSLDEVSYASVLNLTKTFKVNDLESKVKIGMATTYKERDYEILGYRFNVQGQQALNLSGDPDELLLSQNIWTPESKTGTYVVGNFEPSNTYNAVQNIYAAYLMHEVSIFKNLKAIYGARIEKFDHEYTGQNNLGNLVLKNEKLLETTDILPSVNFIYDFTDEMKLRTSYSQTLARPSFKELSIAQIYDAISDRTFIGNLNLVPTSISNIDLRLERFMSNGQMFAISAFYKKFTNPIELVAFSEASPNDLTPRNVGQATVMGIELEIRKNLEFLSTALKSLQLGSNVSFVHSSVELDKSENGEYQSRLRVAREGEVVKDTRQMQGQSPYILNMFLAYSPKQSGLEANLSYNVQGSRLALVGISRNPDVYENPFHSLNLKISQSLGENNDLRLSVAMNNILGENKEKVFTSFGADQEYYEKFAPGRSFSLGISYRIR